MPYAVQHLIEGHADPVTALKEDAIKDVLDRMVEYDFSQLPVIDPDNHPVGMVTYESILRGIRNFRIGIESLRVRDVMVKAPVADIEDDLFAVLEKLKLTNTVLILDSRSTLVGIVTSYDSTEYFRNRAENLMRVEDIEAMVKDLIQQVYTLTNGEVDETGLDKIIASVSKHQTFEKNQKTKGFDELTFSQYISIVLYKNRWSSFEPVFQLPREAVREILESVRDTRNDLAHFRTEITADQSDQLRFCAEWLARCAEEYEQIDEATNVTPESAEMTEAAIARQETVEVIAEETGPRESRYAPLADWLKSLPGKVDHEEFSFEQIERVIGGDLPPSARAHRSWWANDPHSHPHSKMWLEMGWRQHRLNITKGRVSFVRIKERQKAYIDFYSNTLAKLRAEADFSVRGTSPDGTSWIGCKTIPDSGNAVAQFSYSFGRDHRFRVEIYVDTSDQTTTKQIFDYVHEHKDSIERDLGELSWERIDDKRASRIALYRPGDILDDDDALKEIQNWAVEKMILFYNTFSPLIEEASEQVLSS